MKKILIILLLILSNSSNLFSMEEESSSIELLKDIKQYRDLEVHINILIARNENNIITLVEDLLKLRINDKCKRCLQNLEFWRTIFVNFFMRLDFDKELQEIPQNAQISTCIFANFFNKIANTSSIAQLEAQLQKSEELLEKIEIKLKYDAQKKNELSSILILISKSLISILVDEEFWKLKFGNFFKRNIKNLNIIELERQAQKCQIFLKNMANKETFKNNKVIMNSFVSVLNEILLNYKFKKAIFHFDLVKAKDILCKLENNQDVTALFECQDLHKSFFQMEEVITDIGSCINTKNEYYSTVLLHASSLGYADIVKLLLFRPEVNINFQNYYGWTGLMVAASNGKSDIVNAYITAGALLNIKNRLGWTALIVASKLGYKEIVQILVEQPQIKLNYKDNYGWTALMHASHKGYHEIIETLINFGADLNIKNKEGETVLELGFKRVKNISF